MANDLNQCTFVVRLGRDVELRLTSSGTAAASMSGAVGKKYNDKESTTWLNLKAFGKTAEILAQYAKKGSQLAVVCEYSVNEWENKEGQKVKTPEFLIRNFQFLGGGQGGQEQEQAPAQEQGRTDSELPPMDDEDSIPF